MKTTLLVLSAMALMSVLSGCGTKKVSGRSHAPRVTTLLPTGSEVETTTTRGGVRASLDPNSKEAQLVSIKEGTLAGVTVAFPVGSLSIPVIVSITPGASVNGTTLVQNLGLRNNAVSSSGTPVEVTIDKSIDLRNPMILSIPLPKSTSLTGANLTGTTIDRKNLAVLYRIKVAEGSTSEQGSFTGLMPASSLTIDNGNVLFPTKYFGWFSVVVMEQPVTEALQAKARYADQLAAMRYTTTTDLPACTSSDIDRIAYVSSEDRMYYCASSGSWTAIAKTDTSKYAKILKGGVELGRVLSAGSSGGSWKLLIPDSASVDYLIDVNIDSANPSTGIFASDFYSSYFTIYFTGTSCTGTAYITAAPALWAKKAMYFRNTDFTTWNGLYRYTSTTKSTINYQSSVSSYLANNFAPPSDCYDYNGTTDGYPVETFTTLPVPFTGSWSIEF